MALLLIMLTILATKGLGRGQRARPYSGARHQDYPKEETRSTVLCLELHDTTAGESGNIRRFFDQPAAPPANGRR